MRSDCLIRRDPRPLKRVRRPCGRLGTGKLRHRDREGEGRLVVVAVARVAAVAGCLSIAPAVGLAVSGNWGSLDVATTNGINWRTPFR